MTRTRGFILQASYRIQTDEGGLRRPVIHLYGRLENGETFLVRDERQRPRFYIWAADVARARALRTPESRQTHQTDFAGRAVCAIEVATPPDVPAIRDGLHEAGIETFEADVQFAVRYLIERGIKGGCEIEGCGAGHGRLEGVYQSHPDARTDHDRAARALLGHRN